MATTRKTDLDIRREAEAHDMNWDLRGTCIEVRAGGSRGPFAVTVDRLDRSEVRRLVEHIRGWLTTDGAGRVKATAATTGPPRPGERPPAAPRPGGFGRAATTGPGPFGGDGGGREG